MLASCGVERVARISQPEATVSEAPNTTALAHDGAPSTSIASEAPAGVPFPRQRAGVDYMQAFGGGKLVLDGQGCLRLRRGSGVAGDVIAWPHDHSTVTDASGEVSIVYGSGRIVARVGDDVSVGGGEAGDRGIDFVDPDSVPSKRELLRRCPGDLHPAGGEIRVIQDLTAGR